MGNYHDINFDLVFKILDEMEELLHKVAGLREEFYRNTNKAMEEIHLNDAA